MTMNWLFLYDTHPVLAGRWKYCEEYIGPKLWEYAEKIANVVGRKIVFDLEPGDTITVVDEEHHREISRSVDCTTNKVFEMRQNPSNKWFDYKHHSCGVKYETCLAIHKPQVCSIRGPVIPSEHDITVFRGGDTEDRTTWDRSALYFQVREGEKFVGDSGYSGEPAKVIVAKEEHSSEFKEFLARVKNRHETFHARLKSFNILGHCFRHGVGTDDRMRLHKIAMNAVAGIVAYDYENGHPPFSVR